MSAALKVGDLVRDSLNLGEDSYGLGIIVKADSQGLLGERPGPPDGGPADEDITGPRYDVYFNKFERTITFHGDYLEKV